MLSEEARSDAPPKCQENECTYDPDDPELESYYCITYGLREESMGVCRRGTVDFETLPTNKVAAIYDDLTELTEHLLHVLIERDPVMAIRILIANVSRLEQRQQAIERATKADMN